MNKRIKNKFELLKQQGRAGLVTYTMAFDPDKQISFEILKSLPQAGADIIEFGMPFSDPMADGPTIQNAAIRALNSGAKLKEIIQMVADFRQNDNDTPVILMGYYNLVLNYGLKDFAEDCADAGIDGVIIVDLPIEEDDEFYNLSKANELALIKLVTPMTDEARLKQIIKKSSGFIYYVSIAGITGTASSTTESIENAVAQIKKHTDIPVAVGFGIKDKQSAADIGKISDAVVVGSALVKQFENSNQGKGKLLQLVTEISDGLKK